jgi:GNAT superfamily N-acetyltransferase
MKFTTTLKPSKFVKIEIKNGSKKLGRAFLYLIKNDLHKAPYGLMEDVFVDESQRGQGLGTKLIAEIFKQAKKHKCYKLIATSRNTNKKVHQLYQRLGFKKHGIEFRFDFK